MHYIKSDKIRQHLASFIQVAGLDHKASSSYSLFWSNFFNYFPYRQFLGNVRFIDSLFWRYDWNSEGMFFYLNLYIHVMNNSCTESVYLETWLVFTQARWFFVESYIIIKLVWENILLWFFFLIFSNEKTVISSK